jgi:hypothetical protein
MSDIRIKNITVEPTFPLTIQKGNVRITNTTVSIDRITGSLVVDGGVSINCTYNAISSTSGGGLTIGGGFAVNQNSFFGNNITLDNSSSTFNINGISNNRLFLDSILNKNFYISPDGISKRFDLFDTTLNINITKPSTNVSSAALVINGGISINSTFDSINVSNGGSLTVNGGGSFGGSVNINKSLIINQNLQGGGLIVGYTGNQITLNGTTSNTTISMIGNELSINNTNNINISSNNSVIINTLNVGNTSSNFNKFIYINDTTESLNSTIGSLVTIGGISINTTRDSSSVTSGGGLTIKGGLGVNKKIYTGDSLGIELSNANKKNKVVLYQVDNDLTNTSLFTGIGITSGSLTLQVPTTSEDYIFFASTNEILRIKGTNEVEFIGSAQKYSIKGGGFNTDSLSLQSQSISKDNSFNLFTFDGDTTDNNDIKLFGLGLPNNINNSEYLKLGWSKDNLNYILSSNNQGTGISRPIVLQTGNNTNQLLLDIDGSITLNSTKISSNSSTGSLVLNGGLSVNNTTLATSVTDGGGLTIKGGASFSSNVYIRTTLNINTITQKDTLGSLLTQSSSGSFIFSGLLNTINYTSNLSLYSLNNTNTIDYELLSLGCNNTTGSGYYYINSSFDGTGLSRAIRLGVGNFNQITLNTNGNIGINTSNANYTLDINGQINVNTFSYMNGLQINSTVNALNSTTASLLVSGGIFLSKDLISLGLSNFQNTTGSSNSTTASVVLLGGLSIDSSSNSVNVNNGGALSVRGGGSIGGDLYVGGSIYYANPNSVSSTFSSLMLTSTTQSINSSTANLIIKGGMSIQSSMNATSTTQGGGLTVIGGISTNNSIYIGGDINSIGGVLKLNYISSGNLIQMNDNTNRFSIDLTSSNFSISRYNGSYIDTPFVINNSSGSIILNNSLNSTSSTSASVISYGGITINCTTNSVNLGNGGALSVFGGASISKDVIIGGDTIFASTTVSNNTSTGSVIINGGAAIKGNLNVLGNTTISGNLTIIGTTTSIQSTNTLLTDNIFVLNSGPSGSKDSGLIIQRFQIDNDTSNGDVVNDNAFISDIIPLQSGMNINQIKFSVSLSPIDNYYSGWYIKIINGFSNSQVRKIISYTGSTRVATLSSSFTTQNPVIGDLISLYNKAYVGLIYNEIDDQFVFGSTVEDPGQTNVLLTDHLPIVFKSATSTSTQPSINSSTGSMILSGGLSIKNTTDASSITSGGACTINGGLSIEKTLYVGNTVYINGINITPNLFDSPSTVSFTASNALVPTNVTNLLFDNTVWGTDIYLSYQVIATSNYYSNVHLRCINKNTAWELVSEYVGDSVVDFGITSVGQIQYMTSTTFPGFVSCIFKYKVITN